MSEKELARRAAQSYAALTIDAFCKRYSVGRSFAYEQIKLGKLKIKKAGRRTLVRQEDADDWLNSLPAAE